MSERVFSIDSPLGRVDITKFDGTNYHRWSRQVRNALIAIDAWNIIEDDLNVPGEESSCEERKRFRDLDSRGFALIYNSVDELHQVYMDRGIDSCKTAWKLMQMLHARDEPNEQNVIRTVAVYANDTEKWIDEWRNEGRLKSIELVKSLLSKVRDLADCTDGFETAGSSLLVGGSALTVIGSILRLFPQTGALGAGMSSWGSAADAVGVGMCSLTRLCELGFSEKYLNDLSNVLEEDKKETDKLIVKLFNSGELDPLITNALGLDLATYFRMRYGHRLEPGTNEAHRVTRVPQWKNVTHATGPAMVRGLGDYALGYMGVAAATRPIYLHSALLAWSLYYLITTRGLKDKKQYVVSVEYMLKKLQEELKYSYPHAHAN